MTAGGVLVRMTDTRSSIRPAREEEALDLADLHTRTRTAYYAAGGLRMRIASWFHHEAADQLS